MSNIKNIVRNYDADDNLIVSANIDGIQFNNIVNEDLGLNKGSMMSRKNTIWVGSDTTGTSILPAINVVDIDWNGAEVIPGKTLNTTGEMLSVLKTAYDYATTYTGKTSLTTSTELAKINGQSLKYGGSIDIEVGSDYTLPTASTSELGGIKVGDTLSISAGVLNAKATGTVTGVKINNSTKSPSNGVVDLGTVITEHQDISGKADTNHTHTKSQITDFSHTHVMSDIESLSAVLSTISNQINDLSARITTLEQYHASVLVTGISLGQTTATLTGKNSTLTLTPTITPNNATNKSVTWASSSASVATVNGGVVTPLKAGTTTITATTTDGSNKTASCTVTVKDGTTTWTLTPESASINEGEPITFSMAVSSSDTFVTPNANNTSWYVQYKKSSDSSYAYANDILNTTTGNRVTATAPALMSDSSATYFINASNNGYSKTATLYVSQSTVNVSSVTLDKTSHTLNGTTSGTITATVLPANATNKSVTWNVSSSNNAINYTANDNKLTITGRAIGTATVIATADGKTSTSCVVTVKQGAISITGITPSSSEIQEGGSKQLYVTYTSTLFDGTPHNFTWSCSGNNVESNSLLSSTSGSSITFNAPDDLGSTSATTYYINVTSTQASSGSNLGSASVTVKQKPEETKYYWYAGQTQPTADNYTTLEGIQQVTDYPTTFEYTNNSGKRGYAYVILHNSKTLTAVEKVSQATVNFTTDTSIPNYTIYKTTVGIAVNGVIVITIK